MDRIFMLGETPIPKYLKREVEPLDRERFQTIYARNLGAVAVPTAGLHFSKQMLKRLEIKGIDLAFLTLHIGLGTFRPVEVEDLTKHKVDSEQLIIPDDCVATVNAAKLSGRKIVAVGTTALRAMETSVSTSNTLKPFSGWTNKFIFPPFDFRISDVLITNFHTPQSTLLMLTSAFGGHDLVMDAYKEAIKEGYRFYAYGDALMIK
jgi:S-adenosylmethionine:tRNA ribosyltransferase-isomerase